MARQPLTDADKQIEAQAKQNVVQFRFGIQFHVDGPDYRAHRNSHRQNTYRWFKTYGEANRWLREELPVEGDWRGAYRNRYLAPETVRKTALLAAVGIIPGRQRPTDDLFEFKVPPNLTSSPPHRPSVYRAPPTLVEERKRIPQPLALLPDRPVNGGLG
jgi:hypothetical protein